jgi:hypothetical protein
MTLIKAVELPVLKSKVFMS